jgi:hypothetical protein
VLDKRIAASFCTRLCEFRVVAPVSSCRMLFVWHVSGCGALQLARPGEEPGTSAVPDSPASEPVETANKKSTKRLDCTFFPGPSGKNSRNPNIVSCCVFCRVRRWRQHTGLDLSPSAITCCAHIG